MPTKYVLCIREHTQLFRLGYKVGTQNGIRDRFDVCEWRHERRHVRIVGPEDELGRWDTVAEETLDLVVENRSSAVVPDSRRDERV